MALTEAERKKENILDLLQREGWWQGKPAFSELITNGDLLVNGKKTKVTYKPKKGDKVTFGPYSFILSY